MKGNSATRLKNFHHGVRVAGHFHETVDALGDGDTHHHQCDVLVRRGHGRGNPDTAEEPSERIDDQHSGNRGTFLPFLKTTELHYDKLLRLSTTAFCVGSGLTESPNEEYYLSHFTSQKHCRRVFL